MGNHHSSPSLELFLSSQTEPGSVFPGFPLLHRLWSVSVSMNRSALAVSHKCSHMVFVLSCLTWVTEHNVFKGRSCCSMSEFQTSLRLMIVRWINPLVCWWTFGLFPPFAYCVSNRCSCQSSDEKCFGLGDRSSAVGQHCQGPNPFTYHLGLLCLSFLSVKRGMGS